MKITNAHATYEYEIQDRFEAGIKLTGPEVKSIKTGHASLKGAHVRVFDNEAFLINAMVSPYSFARVTNYDPNRTRKLLLHRKELVSLQNKIEGKGLALVPLSIYVKHGLIKVEIGLGKGKKEYEKRAVLKKRQEKKDLERTFRGKVK